MNADVLNRVELRRSGRERQERDVGGDSQLRREVPAGLIQEENCMGSGRDGLRDLGQVQGHGLGGAARQDEAGSLALSWADRAEDVGRLRPLVLGR